MPLTVKICGLKTPQALDVALDSGADMVGFVFFPPSPRHLGWEAARALGQRAQGRAIKVALTVDANNQMLGDIVETLKPDMLQLHGTETPERVAVVRSRFALGVDREFAKTAGQLPIPGVTPSGGSLGATLSLSVASIPARPPMRAIWL